MWRGVPWSGGRGSDALARPVLQRGGAGGEGRLGVQPAEGLQRPELLGPDRAVPPPARLGLHQEPRRLLPTLRRRGDGHQRLLRSCRSPGPQALGTQSPVPGLSAPLSLLETLAPASLARGLGCHPEHRLASRKYPTSAA